MKLLKNNWLVIALAVVIGATLLKLKGLFSWTIGNAETDAPDLQTDPAKTTITQEKAAFYADELHDAMKGGGTDEDKIEAVLECLTTEDFKMVFNAFGKRQYFLEGQPIWPFSAIAQYHKLNDWIKKELSGSHPVYMKFQQLCQSASIPF